MREPLTGDSSTTDRFLESVATNLDLPPEIARGVLEELTGHLAEAAAALIAQGLSAEDAERRAIDQFGDAGRLGAELSRARHRRRQILAGVGGAVWGVVVDGIRTYLFVAIVGLFTALVSLPLASAILHAQGHSSSSYLVGAAGSLVTVGGTLAAAFYLGRVLPARVARSAVRSVRGVRPIVAGAGLVVGSAIAWFVPISAPDQVLAVGLPLTPVAFAVAALTAGARPRFRLVLGSAIGTAVILVAPITVLSVASATDGNTSWSADLSPFGGQLTVADGDVRADWSGYSTGDPESVEITFEKLTTSSQFPNLRLEIWPMTIENGVARFGSAPIATSSVPLTWTHQVIPFQVPRLRDPVSTWTFVIGLRADGGRTVIAEQYDVVPTPPWRGNLLEWWTGRP